MPLDILLPMVVIGIAGLGLLIRLLRPTPAFCLTSPERARDIWNHRNPRHPAGEIHLNRAGTVALIKTPAGDGLLWSFGADPVTRLFVSPPVCHETGSGLRIITGDFTAPKITIPLPDPDERHLWRRVLEAPR